MPKLKAPLFSLKATGRLGKFLALAKRRGRHIIERRPIPTDAKSPTQLFSRLMFTKCVDLWHLLSDAERQEWESAARPKHMTGYAWYISQCLRPNPGIYLPLIGGTMTGDIDMGTNRILNLPDPTVNQQAATKKYHDDNKYTNAQADARIALHAAIAAAHHTAYTDAEADARIALHAAIAAAHHAAFTAANHTAIGNGAPHHARYTDAEAVTAAKTVKLDDFATPDDNADLNASQTRHGLFKKLDGVVTHFLNGLGNWVAIAPAAVTSSGSYTGNSTANRAIAHGLGVTPKLVMLIEVTGIVWWEIFGALAFIYGWYRGFAWQGRYAVTIPNATNFYVGNAAHYPKSANNTGDPYSWVAIG